MKILESSQTLLHVLKRESVNLVKKKQSSAADGMGSTGTLPGLNQTQNMQMMGASGGYGMASSGGYASGAPRGK